MSEDNAPITDDLLIKYLLGETDAAESSQAELWINGNDANLKYFEDFKLIWQQSEQIAANSNPDEDGAWLRLQNRIDKGEVQLTKTVKIKPKNQWLKIAASVLLVSVISYFSYNQFFKISTINKASGSATVIENLPDGTSVTLNSNSQLSYPSRFRGGQRLVQLSGEAFFKVSPDKTKPFIIKIKDVTVSVVGTSFNVKNIKDQTEVIVATGIVKVNSNGRQVLLHPGEMVITGTDNLTVQQTKGSLYNYYFTKALVCEQTPLHELVDKLNQVYNTHIQIANSRLNDLPITTTFKGQTLQQVLNIIAETFKLKVENKENVIYLK